MRLMVALALVALAAGALAAPRPGAITLPAVGALRDVAHLLDCDAHVIAQIGAAPSSVRGGECTSMARQIGVVAGRPIR